MVDVKHVVGGSLRAVVLALLWVFFAGWDLDYAGYGVVSVLAATAMSLVLLPPTQTPNPARWPQRIWFSVRLAAWFLRQSALGGVDVARRAFAARPDIAPAVVVAPVQLPEGHSRQLAMLLMNLMPGSMIQRGPLVPDHQPEGEAGEVVELHTLAAALDPAEQWRQLQLRAGRAFK